MADKIAEDDEGTLDIKCFVKDGVVIMDFGKPVAWIGMPPEDVHLMIKLLQDQLAIAEKTNS